MIETWVLWTLLAVSMQSVRTAGQKHLANDMSPLAATLVRYLFGLPFAVIYLAILWVDQDTASLSPTINFYLPAIIAGVLQIVATILMIRLFMLRNFAVGSTYVRSEILLTAIIGAVFFADAVSLLGWFAISISFVGLVLVSIGKTGKPSSLWNLSALYGFGAGLAFSLTSLLIRKASLSLNTDPMFAAALTLAYMVAIQLLITLVWVALHNRRELLVIMNKWRLSLFVGFTSVVGSAGWFTAFTLERAAYVKTLGQLEFLTTLLISILFFKETPNRIEFAGMAILVIGVLALLLAP